MRMPPDDDALWPRLILLAFTTLLAVVVVLAVWVQGHAELDRPPPSTLVPLAP